MAIYNVPDIRLRTFEHVGAAVSECGGGGVLIHPSKDLL